MISRYIALFFVLVLIGTSAGLNITTILSDDVTVEKTKITHVIKAYENISNVSVIDFYPKGSKLGKNKKFSAEFLGEEREYVLFYVGSLAAGQETTIEYRIESVEGIALLGADTYIINGDIHQLFPKSQEIIISRGKSGGGLGFLILPMVMMILILIALYKYQRRYY